MNEMPVTYVTQEDWDAAQAALRAVLPLVEANVPPLSTSGTAIALRDQVRKALRPMNGEHHEK